MNSSPTVLTPEPSLSELSGPFHVLCWRCATPLAPLAGAPRPVCVCSQCFMETRCDDGIFRSLSPMAQRGFERFIAQYEYIRASEQRGSPDSAYYLALPFADLSGRLGDQWKIRAITFQHIVREIVVPLAARLGRPLNILDLGAGNGWLSYRLSTLGHRPVAVDLLTNDRDGLGAAQHYAAHLPHLFPRVQADLDHLPFASASFDLALFNASFHYSEDFSASLGEALRCVRRGAPVVIADTPWYREERSGLEMVQEKRAHFLKTYGFASDALESQEFLTPDRLQTLARELSVQWRVLKPWYGLDWALRPLRAKLQGRRTPSKFRIFVAKCTA